MSYIAANNLRVGSIFSYDGNLFKVLKYQHIKKGRGQAVIKVKVKNLMSDSIVELSFTNEQSVEEGNVLKQSVQYLYKDGADYYFMNNEDFSQFSLTESELGEDVYFLKEGLKVIVLFIDDKPVSIEVPKSIELQVIDTTPAVAGNTATGATKDAILETGFKIAVPLFIKNGDYVKINTQTGQYTARV